jgi:hypothetical protein
MREQILARLITDMPDDELRAARHDAATGLNLLRPGSAMYGPARSYLGVLDAELAQRHGTRQQGSPGTRQPGVPGMPAAESVPLPAGPHRPEAKDQPHDSHASPR